MFPVIRFLQFWPGGQDAFHQRRRVQPKAAGALPARDPAHVNAQGRAANVRDVCCVETNMTEGALTWSWT